MLSGRDRFQSQIDRVHRPPEAETAYRDRRDEQAAYFRITREQATHSPTKPRSSRQAPGCAFFIVWAR